MAKDFKEGALVWAKMKGFPPWPSQIALPIDGKSPTSKKAQHYVFFFGTHDFAWILDQNIFPHSNEMLGNTKTYKKLSCTMLNAIKEIESASQKGGKKFKLLTKDKVQKKPLNSPPPDVVPEKSKEKQVPKKRMKTEKKRPASVLSNDINLEVKVMKDEDSDEDHSLLIANIPPNSGYSNVAVIPPFKENFKSVAPCLSASSIKLNTETFIQTCKKIGFLGLGGMGYELVKRLISTGHNVTIWNRRINTENVYNICEEASVKIVQSPAEVIQECDITFSCLFDPEAAKCVVFGNGGVLAGLDKLCSKKAYIEMTSIDPVTSQEISEAIVGKGGTYLEALMIGSRQDVNKNSIVILAAGDQRLFTDCNAVFAAWAKHAFYLGGEIGAASKMNLVLSTLAGKTYAALGESLALINKCNISPALFMEIIGIGPVNFPLLIHKGHSIITNDRNVYTPVKNQQKDLSLALALGHTSQQSLPLAAAANEIYKQAKAHDKEVDVSKIHKLLK